MQERVSTVNVLRSGEDFLLKRLYAYASEAEYTRYTSTKEEEWRMTLRQPARAPIEFVETHDGPDTILAAAWTAAIVLGVAVQLRETYMNTLELVHIQAAASFEKDLVYRRWVAGHGWVYVPPAEETPPNPYLSPRITGISRRD